jgi:isoquinoline 1-oxidoreductase beta subunit
VVAQNTHAARQGRDAVTVQWDDARAERRGSEQLLSHYHDIAAGRVEGARWQAFETRGDTAAPYGGQTIDFSYDFPYLAHAAMEPMNCVAQVGAGPPRLTFASQSPSLDQLNTARICGVLPGSVEIETLFAGGSFGRRTNFPSDYVAECVHIAKHVGGGRPVKLVWTREDDMAAGYFRPLIHHSLKVGLGADGYPAYWRHRLVSQSIMKGSPIGGGGLDATSVEGAKGSPYLRAIPIVDAQLASPDVKIPVQWWRSVGATHTAFVMEHTIDQLARRAGKDPIEYRRTLYTRANAARHLAALNLAVERAGPAAAAGYTRGVAVHESFGSVVAQVAEVKMEGPEPRVGRVVTAIDCGIAVSPDQVAAQMEGGTCYGLSAALFGQMTITDGQVQEKNFDTARMLRMNEAPSVETHIVPSTNPPSGVGEPGTPVIAPAVANALLAMENGQPTMRLPFVRST